MSSTSRSQLLLWILVLFLISGISSGRRPSARALRGGRGGGGGGSRGGGGTGGTGGSSRGTSGGSYFSRMGTGGKLLAGAAVGLLAFGLLGGLFPAVGIGLCGALCCAASAGAAGVAAGAAATKGTQSKKYPSKGNGGGILFPERVDEARRQVIPSGKTNYSTPYSGEYTTHYIDNGMTHQAKLKLKFEDIDYGYKITGNGSDVDGLTRVEEGFANYDGVAWWIEETITGDVGLHILSTGKFDFPDRSFLGSWFANTDESGVYTDFKASGDSGIYPDVPIVTATLVEETGYYK